MENLSPLAQGIIAALTGTLFGPLIMYIIQRVFNKEKDATGLAQDLQKLSESLGNQIVEERQKHQEEMSQIRTRVEELERTRTSPIELKVQLVQSQPEPIIVSTEVRYVTPPPRSRRVNEKVNV